MKYFKICLFVLGLLLSAKVFAQTNPLLNYYPLHVGDAWQYKITYHDPSYSYKTLYAVKKIITDTILANGKRYFLVEQPPFTYNKINSSEIIFVRVDSSNGVVYQYLPAKQQEEKIDSLFCRVNDKFFGGWFCWDISNQTVLSVIKETATIGGPLTTNGNDIMWKRAINIGVYFQSNYMTIVTAEGNQYDLVYAKINGVEYGQLVDVKEEKNFLPQEFSLSQNYPNPFNPSTTIIFSIPASLNPSTGGTFVLLKVYDLLGREVATLVNEEKASGEYSVEFRALPTGRQVQSSPSGVYFYRLTAGSFSETKKMVLLK